MKKKGKIKKMEMGGSREPVCLRRTYYYYYLHYNTTFHVLIYLNNFYELR